MASRDHQPQAKLWQRYAGFRLIYHHQSINQMYFKLFSIAYVGSGVVVGVLPRVINGTDQKAHGAIYQNFVNVVALIILQSTTGIDKKICENCCFDYSSTNTLTGNIHCIKPFDIDIMRRFAQTVV